jgi:hypothetical protein
MDAGLQGTSTRQLNWALRDRAALGLVGCGTSLRLRRKRQGAKSRGALFGAKKVQGLKRCVSTGKETAGPSTTLRSGRDDNSVLSATASARNT